MSAQNHLPNCIPAAPKNDFGKLLAAHSAAQTLAQSGVQITQAILQPGQAPELQVSARPPLLPASKMHKKAWGTTHGSQKWTRFEAAISGCRVTWVEFSAEAAA